MCKFSISKSLHPTEIDPLAEVAVLTLSESILSRKTSLLHEADPHLHVHSETVAVVSSTAMTADTDGC